MAFWSARSGVIAVSYSFFSKILFNYAIHGKLITLLVKFRVKLHLKIDIAHITS